MSYYLISFRVRNNSNGIILRKRYATENVKECLQKVFKKYIIDLGYKFESLTIRKRSYF